jgi:hypothetical protein
VNTLHSQSEAAKSRIKMPESVFDTFPWPQKPKHEDKAVAEAAVTLRALRQETMRKLNYSLPPQAIFRLVFSG